MSYNTRTHSHVCNLALTNQIGISSNQKKKFSTTESSEYIGRRYSRDADAINSLFSWIYYHRSPQRISLHVHLLLANDSTILYKFVSLVDWKSYRKSYLRMLPAQTHKELVRLCVCALCSRNKFAAEQNTIANLRIVWADEQIRIYVMKIEVLDATVAKRRIENCVFISFKFLLEN